MSDSLDILVVGGGPGGLFAASRLASEGFRVVVCEEHAEIGDPVHCTGVLAEETFDEFGLSRQAVLNPLSTVQLVSPSGLRIHYTTPRVEAVVIDRGAFDRDLAARAVAAGADVRTGTRVSAIDIGRSGVRARAGDTELSARLVVLACGARYFFQRRFGLGLPSGYLHTAQRELPAERHGDVEMHFGSEIAPSGFAWAVPVNRPSGLRVRIGVMARRVAPRWYGRMLQRMQPEWGILDSGAVPRQKILPLGPIARTVADRLVVIGDAAGIVKPTTGGGIYYSLMSGSLAAETIADGLRRNRLDALALRPYETRWRRRLSSELDAQVELREIAEAMTDTEIDALFDLAKTDGIMPIVRKTARFNQHRHVIRALLNHPPARKVLFRALAG